MASVAVGQFVIDAALFDHRRPAIVRVGADALQRVGGLGLLKQRNAVRMRQHIEARDSALVNYPAHVQLEVSTVCNIRCRMCSLTRPSRSRERTLVDDAVYERLRPILPYVSTAKLQGGGEPFLHQRIERIIETFAEYGVELTTVTNATLIDDARARLIADSFVSISVSMDGATASTYELVRERAKFSKVLAGIELINKYRKPGFELIFGIVIMRCNAPELAELMRLAKRCGANRVDGAWLVPFRDLPWSLEQEPTAHPEEMNRHIEEARAVGKELGLDVRLPSALPVNPQDRGAPKPLGKCVQGSPGKPSRDSKQPPQAAKAASADRRQSATSDKGAKRGPVHGRLLDTIRVTGTCVPMYDRALVQVSGHVKPCCHASTTFGSLMESDFDAIWNSPRYQELRATFNAGTLPGPCRNCNFLRSGRLKGAALVPAG